MSGSFDLEKSLRELAESKDLLQAVSDIDYAKHIVDAICEATDLDRWKVQLAYKVIVPLMGHLGKGLGSLLSDIMKHRLLSLAERFAWTEKIVKALKDASTKTIKEIQAQKEAKAFLRGRRPLDQEALEFRKHMSLEFNVMLDTLAATQSTQGELAGILPEIRKALGTITGFVNPQPRFKRELLHDDRNRFVYRSEFIPFLGRDKELSDLDTFLSDDSFFRWQAITGPAGSGKSRLAWEFCRRKAGMWRAGFLADVSFPFAAWQPDRPTLLVLDYASKDRAAVKAILTALAEREMDLDCAVRVLLLDRDSSDEWLTEVWPGSDGHVVECCRHQDRWELDTTIGVMETQEILRFFLEGKSSLSESDIQKHLNVIEIIDHKKRPIFAAFYADAIAREGVGRRWDMESLIRDVINREKEQYWKKNGERFVTQKDESLLALSTIVGGIRSTQWPLIPQVTPASELINSADRFDALCGYVKTQGQNDEHLEFIIPPWEPDLVGELFVLDLLKNNKLTKSNSLRKQLLNFSWDFSQVGTVSFINRAIQDFPAHGNIRNIIVPPSNKEQQKIWLYVGLYMSSWPASKEKLSIAEMIYSHAKKIYDADPRNKFLGITFTKIIHEYLKICIDNDDNGRIKAVLQDATMLHIMHHNFEVVIAGFSQILYTGLVYAIKKYHAADIDTHYGLIRCMHNKFPKNVEIALVQSKSIMQIVKRTTDIRYLYSRIGEIKKLRAEFMNNNQIESVYTETINLFNRRTDLVCAKI